MNDISVPDSTFKIYGINRGVSGFKTNVTIDFPIGTDLDNEKEKLEM